ncbi:hypothetical protein WDU94_003187 [Cyamophila willieti]
MDPKFVAEVQKLLKQDYSDEKQSKDVKKYPPAPPLFEHSNSKDVKKYPPLTLNYLSGISRKNITDPFTTVKLENDVHTQDEESDLVSEGTEFRSVQQLQRMREEYLNLQKLKQIALDHLKGKQEHLLSLQEQVKEKVRNVRQDEDRRKKQQMAIKTLIERKRKVKILKLKISLCEKNIEIRQTTREQSKAEYKRIEEKLRNIDTTYELINQRDYLLIERKEFQEKTKDYKLKITNYEISKEKSNKFEHLKRKEDKFKSDMKQLNEQMQQLMNMNKMEEEKIIAEHSEEIKTLQRNNNELENEIRKLHQDAENRNKNVNQFMNHVNNVDYNNYEYRFEEMNNKCNDDTKNYNIRDSKNYISDSILFDNNLKETNNDNNILFGKQTLNLQNYQMKPFPVKYTDETEIYKLVNDKSIESKSRNETISRKVCR